MAILDLQRRLREVGRIRIGVQVPIQGKPGKTRPAKLDTFRLTSQDEVAIKAAADLFGGTPQRWDGAPTGEQWEVITSTNVIPVVVPPAATAFSQWYELWSGGGCTRRCDGMTELLTEQPCLCASDDERSCTPHSRLNVILRDLPGLGVWRLETQGWYAATELAGTVEVCIQAATRGQLLPAVLRLEQRQAKRPGEQTRKFAVPVLDIQMTPSALGLVVGSQATGEITAPDGWRPIEQAAPAELGTGGFGDAVRAAPEPKARRKNSPPELPPTGLNPRGQQTAVGEVPSPAVTEAPPPSPLNDEPGDGPSKAQTAMAMALFTEAGITDRDERLTATSTYIGRDVTTWKDVTRDEASKVIDSLRNDDGGEP